MAYISKYSGEEIDGGINQIPQINTNVDDLQSQINELKSSLTATILNTIYPIGSLYTSFEAINPATLIGGTWEQIKDTFLLAAGDTYTIETSGGTAAHSHKISPGKAWATIGNYSETTCFGAGIGDQLWKDWTDSSPYCWTHSADSALTSSNSRYESGQWTNVYGSVDEESILPPYQTIYMWKRIS